MRHKKLHTKYGYWLTPLALSLLLTGCTQYNFADSLRTTDTVIQTETVTNTVTKNTTQSDSDSSSEDSTDKEPVIEHNVESAPAYSNENSGQVSNPGNNIYIPDTPNTANSLDYPDGGYKTITDTYIKAVMDTINTMRLNSGLSPVSQSSTYAEDANIYAARMAAENRFIGQNTNNSASLATCMTSRESEKSICSSVQNMLAQRPAVLNASNLSIGIATGTTSGYVYLCFFYN